MIKEKPQNSHRFSSQGIFARIFALNAITDVRKKKISVKYSLGGQKYNKFSQVDKRFIREIVSGSFRKQNLLAFIMNRYVKNQNDMKLLDLIGIGLYQLYFMKVSEYAAVDTTVTVAKKVGLESKAGLVNAVLRVSIKEKEEILKSYKRVDSFFGTLWEKEYGKEKADNIFKAIEKKPYVDIVFKDSQTAETYHDDRYIKIAENIRRVYEYGEIEKLYGYKHGEWWVQDYGATVGARFLQNMLPKGGKIADLCSAPGGKTMFFAAHGYRVSAFDIDEERIKRMEDNLKRTKLNAEIFVKDVNAIKDLSYFDGVFLDAPCTSTGIVRRNPEILYIKEKEEIEYMVKVQEEMLKNVFMALKTGSFLLYSVCSLNKAEGEEQINKFLTKNKNATIVKAQSKNFSEEMITQEGYLRLLPFLNAGQEFGMDGFFFALIQKK